MASLEVLLQGGERTYTDEMKEHFANKKNGIYQTLLEGLSPKNLEPEVKATLEAVRAAGLKMGIGSSSKNTKLILKRLGLNTFFDAVADGTDVSHAKPNPEVFLIAAARLGVEPKACLVVEDASSGIMAAKAAGMDVAAIGEATELGFADYKLTHLSQLQEII
jgi:HAD superfamily hydrolase (TIGR01509 family)